MRIRSIKPEFWRSRDITSLPWDARLVFIGLWSYVDDNGVGWDDLPSIAADLFAYDLSVDTQETLRRVSNAAAALEARGLIVRYRADEKDLLMITGWKKHQIVQRPSLGHKYPEYQRKVHPEAAPLLPLYGDYPETLRTGTGEQGNRGTGEQGNNLAHPQAGERAQTTTAQTIIAEWIDHCTERPPSRVIGHLSKEVKALLEEGVAPERVRAAVIEWHRRGLHPSTLPSIVHELSTPRTRTSARTPSRIEENMAVVVDLMARQNDTKEITK